MEAKRPAPADAARRLDDLSQAHERRVLAYALRRTSSPADAEDAAAETFTIARRVIANQRRGSQRRARLFQKLGRQSAPASVSIPEDDSTDGPALAALARLRPDDQELLRLVAWDELDHRVIGQVLGISSNAVAIRLHRARRRFRDELMKDPGGIRTSTEAKGTINGAMQERVE